MPSRTTPQAALSLSETPPPPHMPATDVIQTESAARGETKSIGPEHWLKRSSQEPEAAGDKVEVRTPPGKIPDIVLKPSAVKAYEDADSDEGEDGDGWKGGARGNALEVGELPY